MTSFLPARNVETLACSFFKQARDAQATPWTGSWKDLVRILGKTNRPQPGPAGGVEDPKKGLPAIASATFIPPHRGKEQAKTLSFLGLDYDNSREEVLPGEFHKSGMPKTRKVPIDRPVTMEDAAEAIRNAGVCAYLWTTWNHREDWPRFRVLVPFAVSVPAALWEPGTEWALGALGLLETRRGLDVGALRDVARMYFLPGHPDGPDGIRRQEIAGEALQIPLHDLSNLKIPEMPMLPHVRQERDRRRYDGYAWAASVPVDLFTLPLADLIAALGVKVGPGRPYKGGMKWRTNCLWPEEHSHSLDDDSGVVIHLPGHWPIWFCSHACHHLLNLEDVLRVVGLL